MVHWILSLASPSWIDSTGLYPSDPWENYPSLSGMENPAPVPSPWESLCSLEPSASGDFSSCDLVLPFLRPQGWGKCDHEFTHWIDKVCVFHQVGYLSCFILYDICSFLFFFEKTLITEIIIHIEKYNVVKSHVPHIQYLTITIQPFLLCSLPFFSSFSDLF